MGTGKHTFIAQNYFSLTIMDALPQELIDRISSHLTHGDLKHTLTLNKAFNSAAEQQSGGFSHFELTENNSQGFVRVYGGHRFRLLHEVVFRTHFPSILEKEYDDYTSCRETKEELRKKDEIFTNQIGHLFQTLHTVEQRAEGSNVGKIRITIYGPTRHVAGHLGRSCLHRMYISWRIRLLSPEQLPQLSSVQSLQLNQGETTTGFCCATEISKLDLRMMIDLASRLTRLNFIGCDIGREEVCPKYVERSRPWAHYEHDWEGPRMESRHHFAEAVEATILPTSLQRARLNFLGNYDEALRTQDQHQEMPDLVGSTNLDPFSVALCTFSHNLKVLEISGMFDAGLFARHESDHTPWPNLESIVVMFWPVSPSGAWYFQGPGGEGSQTASFAVTEQHFPPTSPDTNDVVHDQYLNEHGRGDDIIAQTQFRVVPNAAVLNPFLTAFAMAASRMPKLKDANLWTPLLWYNNDDVPENWVEFQHLKDRWLAWGVAYDKPSQGNPRKLTWRVADWRPNERLHALFRNIGHDQHGDTLEEDWTDEESGDALVNRSFFSDYEVSPYV